MAAPAIAMLLMRFDEHEKVSLWREVYLPRPKPARSKTAPQSPVKARAKSAAGRHAPPAAGGPARGIGQRKLLRLAHAEMLFAQRLEQARGHGIALSGLLTK
jgi:hypothetical protein